MPKQTHVPARRDLRECFDWGDLVLAAVLGAIMGVVLCVTL